MAVAETSLVRDKTPAGPHADLGWKSLLGAAFVLASIGFVFTGLPMLWNNVLEIPRRLGNEFLSGALLIIVTIGAGTGLFLAGRHLERNSARPGSRAGAAFVAVYALFLLWIVSWLGNALAQLEFLGLILTVGLIGGLAFFAFRLFHKPGFCQWLVDLEEQGWFHATSYKANQGVRVRRGTVIALLVLGITGVITMVTHNTLGARTGRDWYMWIPFAGDDAYGYYLPLLFSVNYTLPILLTGVVCWFAWRITNWPTFADFLIATEAEMNKVSWTSRKRLVQDTIVVLVTVLVLTVFLFVVDFMWIRILESPFINVLQLNIKEAQQKQMEKAQW